MISVSTNTTFILYTLWGGFIMLFGLISLFIKNKLFMSESFVATLYGIIIGPAGLNLLSSSYNETYNETLMEVSRLVVAAECLAAGMTTPGNYVFRERKSLGFVLGPIMIAMWITSSVGIYWIFGLGWYLSLLIGAIVTPTDPVLASSVVRGKFAEMHVPLQIRLLLTAESASNDGLALPFLYFSNYLFQETRSPGMLFWILESLLYQVGVAVALGIVVGWAARKLVKYSHFRGLVDNESMVTFGFAFTFFVVGTCNIIGADDVLACYVAGVTLTWDLWLNRQLQNSHFQESLDSLVNLTYFIIVGTAIPWKMIGNVFTQWHHYLIIIWILVLRRMPFILAAKSYIPVIKSWKGAFFLGWFGPMGASSLFYMFYSVVKFKVDPEPIISIVFVIVLSSIVVHCGSVSLFHLGMGPNPTEKPESTRDAHNLVVDETATDLIALSQMDLTFNATSRRVNRQEQLADAGQ
jgi:NhaP-type Na+/H+ or K+/H+ antiporter